MRWLLVPFCVVVLTLPAMAAETTVTLAVPGIACKSCAGDVGQALQRQHGVRKVTVALAQRRVIVQYESNQIALPQLLQAIDAIGFTATPVAH